MKKNIDVDTESLKEKKRGDIGSFLRVNRKYRTIEQFSGVTLVEQYENGKDRMHFYVYTTGGQLRNKSSDKANNKDFESIGASII